MEVGTDLGETTLRNHNIYKMKKVKLFEDFTANTKTYVFVGDIMQHPDQINYELDNNFAYDGVFDEVLHLFTNADMVLGNLETTISESLEADAEDRTGKFRAHPKFLEALMHAGITHLATENNHMLDYGKNGYDTTLDLINKSGIIPINRESGHILNLTTHINGQDRLSLKEIKELIKPAEDTSSIAYIHWGDQYNSEPTDEQVKVAKLTRDAGYAMIIGSGTHTYNFTTFDGNLIAYSLGDFLSNHQAPDTTDVGKILTVDITEGRVSKAKEYYTTTNTDQGKSKIVITGSKVIL